MADNEVRISDVPHGLIVTGVRLDKAVVTKAADFVTSNAAGEWGMGTDTGGRQAPTHDEIAQLAFSLYEARGRQNGQDVEDWLRAEQEPYGLTRNCEVPSNKHRALNGFAQTRG